ncbi:MAG: phosphoribosyltransferase [Acidimicrobiales bacterium]
MGIGGTGETGAMAEGPPYQDRSHAGAILARRLLHYAGRDDVVVLALPRGGVPVGYEVARALGVGLDVFLVRKLGVPGHEELAMGAIASAGVRVVNPEVVTALGIDDSTVDAVVEREEQELARRDHQFRQGRPPPEVAGKVVILVDDGLATGASMRAAVALARQQGPHRIVVAVPTGASAICDELAGEVDEVHCVASPTPFHAVGLAYRQFPQMTDEEVCLLMDAASEPEGYR